MPTAHISAERGDFAEAILLPGDPLRAKYIAETFLEDAREVTAVRNMLGFTGSYKGTPVSVMGTGMGIPSASIYATELIKDYGVRRLVRVGSCGGIGADIGLRDVILAAGACTDSQVNRARYDGQDFAAIADFGLLRAAASAADQASVAVRVGNVHSAELFYDPRPTQLDMFQRMGILAIEMEAAGLYGVAAEFGARALGIMTVSDLVPSGEQTTSEERERTFGEMITIALEALLIDAA
jgi:purine-nucleoside phosphorylase